MFDELEELGEQVKVKNINDANINEVLDTFNKLYSSNKAIINYHEMLIGAMKKIQTELESKPDDLLYIGFAVDSDYYIVKPKKSIVGNHKDGFKIGCTAWKCKIQSDSDNYVELDVTSEDEAVQYAKRLLEERLVLGK